MPPGQRRASIIAAARQLLISTKVTFTIRQVAEAAGIAEGTIFRHFDSKDELLWAVVDDVFDPADLCAGIEALPGDLELAQRVEGALELMASDLGNITAVMTAVHPRHLHPDRREADSHQGPEVGGHRAAGSQAGAAGRDDLSETDAGPGAEDDPGRPRHDHPQGHHPEDPRSGIRAWFAAVTACLNDLLEPYADRLRIPADQACTLLVSAVTTTNRPFAGSAHQFTPTELTDILLNGIATPPAGSAGSAGSAGPTPPGGRPAASPQHSTPETPSTSLPTPLQESPCS